MTRSMLLASATALLFAVPSFAEETPKAEAQNPNMLVELEDESIMVEPFNISAGELEDMNIEDSNGEVIGEVEEVLSTRDGKVVGISTEVGGYLGIGDREVILSLDKVELKDGKLMTSLTEAEIENLPNRDKS